MQRPSEDDEIALEYEIQDEVTKHRKYAPDVTEHSHYLEEVQMGKVFEPSEELSEEWKRSEMHEDKTHGGINFRRTQSLPDKCKKLIRKWVAEIEFPGDKGQIPKGLEDAAEFEGQATSACKEPAPKGPQMCSKAYEIPMYRLGDVFTQWKENGSHRKLADSYTTTFFPESIAAKYINKLQDFDTGDDSNKRLAVLSRVINGSEYGRFEKPDWHELVVHLRLGEAANQFHVDDFWYRKQAGSFMASRQKMMNAHENIKIPKVPVVTLVYGDHLYLQKSIMSGKDPLPQDKKKLKRSFARIKEIKVIFEDMGFIVHTRINRNADCDVIYMAHANNLLQSGGGFSQIMGDLVQLHGGHTHIPVSSVEDPSTGEHDEAKHMTRYDPNYHPKNPNERKNPAYVVNDPFEAINSQMKG